MSTFKKSSIFLAVIFTATFFSQCNIKDDISKLTEAAEDLRILIGTPEFSAIAQLQLMDAKTNQFITTDATITLSGTDSKYIYNNLGEKQAEYKSSLGMLSLAVDPHFVDLIKTTPIEFDLTIKATGYATVSQKVKFTEAKLNQLTVNMIKLDQAPVGVTVTVNPNIGNTNSTGAIAQTTTQTLNSGTETVEVAQGVIMKDEAGVPVTGNIESQVVFYDPTSQDALKAFPGGLTSDIVKNGVSETARFETVGVFDINLTVGGQSVKNFENGGIKIKTELDPSLINPKTNKQYAENDLIDMWSLNNGSTEWKFERTTMVKKINGKLVLEETITHLSAWQWANTSSTCAQGLKIKWTGDDSKIANLTIGIVFNDGDSYDVKEFLAQPNDTENGFVQFTDVSHGQATFEILSYKFNITPNTFSVTDFCNTDTKEVNISLKDNFYTVNTKLILSEKATPNVQLALNGNVNMQRSDVADEVETIPAKDGEFKIYVELGVEYIIWATLGTNTAKGKVVFISKPNNKVDIEYTPVKADGSLGTKVINAGIDIKANKTIDFTYSTVL